MNITDRLRLLAATMRVTRLIVADDVPGQWWIKDPIDDKMRAYVDRQTATVGIAPAYGVRFVEPWWWKYRQGLDCPYCVGVHVSAWMLAIEKITARYMPQPVRTAWLYVTSALALAEIAVTAGQAIGDYGTGEDA